MNAGVQDGYSKKLFSVATLAWNFARCCNVPSNKRNLSRLSIPEPGCLDQSHGYLPWEWTGGPFQSVVCLSPKLGEDTIAGRLSSGASHNPRNTVVVTAIVEYPDLVVWGLRPLLCTSGSR